MQSKNASTTSTTTETWLCAHDLSDASSAALREAASLVAGRNARLILLHVHDLGHLPSHEQTGQRTLEVENDIRVRLDQKIQSLREQYPQLQVRVVVLAGDARQVIMQEAEREGADHIVVGTHGRTGLAHLVLGSVAEAIVRDAKVPVLVVRSKG